MGRRNGSVPCSKRRDKVWTGDRSMPKRENDAHGYRTTAPYVGCGTFPELARAPPTTGSGQMWNMVLAACAAIKTQNCSVVRRVGTGMERQPETMRLGSVDARSRVRAGEKQDCRPPAADLPLLGKGIACLDGECGGCGRAASRQNMCGQSQG